MKNSGKSSQVAVRLILWSFLLFVAVVASGYLIVIIGGLIKGAALALFALWGLLSVGIYFYFRDPDPVVPVLEGVFIAPISGKVEEVEEVVTTDWMDGEFQKIVIKIGVFDIPIQYAPIFGGVSQHIYKPGDWQGSTDASRETLSIELESGEVAGEKMGLRLIAGKVGRRIVSWTALNEEVEQGQRMVLMQLGTRCEVFLPLTCELQVKVDTVLKGGESVLAERPKPQSQAS